MFLWTLVRILLQVVIDVRSERNSGEELLFIRKQPNKTKKPKPFCLCDNESNRLLKSMLSLFENWWDLPLAMLLSVLPDCVCCLFSCAMFRKTEFVWEYVTLNAGTNTATRVMLSHFSESWLSLNEYITCCIYLLFKREKKQCNFVLVPDFCFHPVSSIPAPCALASNVFRLCSHYKPSTEVFSTLLCNLVSPGLAGFLYPGFSSCDSLNSLAFYLLDIHVLAAKSPAHLEITATEVSFNSHSMQTGKWKELVKVEYRGTKKEKKPRVEEGD